LDDPLVGPDEFSSRLQTLLDPAYRLATVMLLDEALAEDVVTDAALGAWRRFHRAGGDVVNFRTWFLASVVRACRRAPLGRLWRFLRPGRAARLLASTDRPPVAGPDLRQAIVRFGTTTRAALFCLYYLDLPMDEVARVVGLTTPAARVRVYEAAQRLRPGLDPSEAPR
jgi:DNA-directed RNA polymerase specialized sigma24 family protein